jgi:hypothetical protein
MDKPLTTDLIAAAPTKAEVISILQKSQLPQRFKAGLAQDWGAAHGVSITADDYAAMSKKA